MARDHGAGSSATASPTDDLVETLDLTFAGNLE
jgi:hypothetical protein